MRDELIDYLDSNNMPEYYIQDKYSDAELVLIVEKHKYLKRREDGQKYSDLKGAELVLSNYDDITKKEIDTFFKEAQQFLCQGWWKSALRNLMGKTPNQYVTQTIYDDIFNYIQNYINESYT